LPGEMADTAIREHIRLYVHDFSMDLGREGEQAVRRLLRAGEDMDLFPHPREVVFALWA
jgi:5,8-dihydroxy-2-naphthoate synthase